MEAVLEQSSEKNDNSTMDIDGKLIDGLAIEYLVLLTPSVIGSFSVLVFSILRWRHLREQVHLLVQLALADLLAALILMSTSVMNLVGSENIVLICQYSLPLSLTFYFISFLLVVVYAWKSKNAIQGWRARDTEGEGGQNLCKRKIVAIPVYWFVWLIPIALYFAYVFTLFIRKTNESTIANDGSSAVQNKSKYCNSCILFLHVWKDPCPEDEKYHDLFIKIFLFSAVIPVMLSCSAIYYKACKWYDRHEQGMMFPPEGDGRSRRRSRRMFSTAKNMVMVIFFCWTPALILILLSTLSIWTNIEQRKLFALYVIQAATVSLQGFLNSMVYGWGRLNFREAVLGENTPLLAHDRLAFFEESLRSTL
ncbi:transmembrane protein 116 [Centropristis striata]|uniref:transmembrane protein 116 n=1 Tax=Centropristis striata TaxID=184440 RepID=UPI0027E10378|nr:transmembrane protein 116 [Centropristis striata]